MRQSESKSKIVGISVLSLVLAALIVLDFWQPGRAVAAMLLGLVLPGLLLSYLILPARMAPGLRAVLAITGSLVISILVGLVLVGFFRVSRVGVGVAWATATVALAAAALVRQRLTYPPVSQPPPEASGSSTVT